MQEAAAESPLPLARVAVSSIGICFFLGRCLPFLMQDGGPNWLWLKQLFSVISI